MKSYSSEWSTCRLIAAREKLSPLYIARIRENISVFHPAVGYASVTASSSISLVSLQATQRFIVKSSSLTSHLFAIVLVGLVPASVRLPVHAAGRYPCQPRQRCPYPVHGLKNYINSSSVAGLRVLSGPSMRYGRCAMPSLEYTFPQQVSGRVKRLSFWARVPCRIGATIPSGAPPAYAP